MSGVERPLSSILRCWPLRPDLADYQINHDVPTLAKQPALGAQRRARIYPPDLLIECTQPKGVGGTARADVFETHRADVRSDGAVAAQLSASISDGVSKARPGVELTFLGLEFGPRPVMDVLTALRTDHWLHSTASVDPARRADIQSQMRNAFYSESPDWQAAIYGRAADFMYRGCRGLSTSSSAQSSSKEA
jgi:hypothetical protein